MKLHPPSLMKGVSHFQHSRIKPVVMLSSMYNLSLVFDLDSLAADGEQLRGEWFNFLHCLKEVITID